MQERQGEPATCPPISPSPQRTFEHTLLTLSISIDTVRCCSVLQAGREERQQDAREFMVCVFFLSPLSWVCCRIMTPPPSHHAHTRCANHVLSPPSRGCFTLRHDVGRGLS